MASESIGERIQNTLYILINLKETAAAEGNKLLRLGKFLGQFININATTLNVVHNLFEASDRLVICNIFIHNQLSLSTVLIILPSASCVTILWPLLRSPKLRTTLPSQVVRL